jgi:hypothetical protein
MKKNNKSTKKIRDKFDNWIRTSEYDNHYNTNMTDSVVKQFKDKDLYNSSKLTVTYLTVNNVSDMSNVLSKLSKHSDSSELFILSDLEYGVEPHTYIYNNLEIMATSNHKKMMTFRNVVVNGFVEKNNKSYIVTTDYVYAYNLFPKMFERFEYLNPSISNNMSILYDSKCVRHLTTIRFVDGIKNIVKISINANCINTVDPITTIFESVEQKLYTSIGILKKGRYSGHKNEHPFDNIVSLGRVCDMFDRGLLDIHEFKLAKKMLLS